jgi:L-arabinokinase
MWRLTRPARAPLHDLDAFLYALSQHTDLFDTAAPLHIGRAPGRLDLLGGIADYSGSLVLEWPLAAAAYVAAQPCAAPTVTVRTATVEAAGGAAEVAVPLALLCPPQRDGDYATLRAQLHRDPHQAWAAYILGAVAVLWHECGVRRAGGLTLLVSSDVPAGKGVSSSAAIEVAAMTAVAGVLGAELPGRQLALLCQKVENLIVGAPCGVMDQMTSACGTGGELLALLCQPAELQPSVKLPDGLAIWGIDSGIRHAVSGSDYGSVRVGAFMGYRILAHAAGLAAQPLGPGRVRIDDPACRGYLANVSTSDWRRFLPDALPESLGGAEFLARFGGITDTVTHVDPGRTYAVRAPTLHPIHEHERVSRFRDLLRAGAATEAARRELGALMYAAHESYSACGLGSDGTDDLVQRVRTVGPERGLYGAKITGGGSGGTIAVLGRTGNDVLIEQLAADYSVATGRSAVVLGGTSPGAAATSVMELNWSTR